MSNALRKYRRAVERKNTRPIRIPLMVWNVLCVAARDLKVHPETLIVNTLMSGLDSWAKEKAEKALITVPGGDLHKRILEEAKHG